MLALPTVAACLLFVPDIADWSAYGHAWAHVQAKRLDQGRAGLQAVADCGRKNFAVVQAQRVLAFVLGQQGDAAGQERYDRRSDNLAEEVRQTAQERCETGRRVADQFLQAGDYANARAAFERWQPHSDCGTCRWSMEVERHQFITLCRLNLGRHAAVAEEIARSGSFGGPNGVLLVRLYREAGQTADLVALLGRATGEYRADADYLLRLVRLEDAADVPALVGWCRAGSRPGLPPDQYGWTSWRNRAAADALVRCLGTDPVRLLPAVRVPSQHDYWLYLALARTGSPAAVDRLAELARAADTATVSSLTYALAQCGPAGRRALESLRADKAEHVASAAGWRLEWHEPGVEDRPFPPPRPGSLPR